MAQIKPYSAQLVKPQMVWLNRYAYCMGIRDLLAANLKARLAALGWSQQEFYRRKGAAQSTVGALIRGDRAADVDTVADLAEKLDCEAWQLLLPPNSPNQGMAPAQLGDTLAKRTPPDPREAQLLEWFKRISPLNKERLFTQAKLFCLEDDPERLDDSFEDIGIPNLLKKEKKKNERDGPRNLPGPRHRKST